MVNSNVTSLLHLRIHDPELHCHECVGSWLRQHSQTASHLITRATVSRNKWISCSRYRAASDKRMQRNLWKKNCQEVILRQQCVCFSWD
jgi:hypothetical protein